MTLIAVGNRGLSLGWNVGLVRRGCMMFAGALVLAASGCGGKTADTATKASPSTSTTDTATNASPSTSTTADVMSKATIDDKFQIASGQHLALRCFGTGTPAIVLVAGDDSSGDVFPSEFIRPLASKRMTCTYDRLGTGRSDPPLEKRRTIDNVVTDLDQLLDAAKITIPVVLVGSSGGGNIAAQYATHHADRLAGLGLLDVGSPTADLGKEFPGALAWKNPEHIDWVAAELEQTTLDLPVGPLPVLVVVADSGQTNPKAKSYWLKLSPNAQQIVMHGGHDIYQDIPDAVAHQILLTLA